MPRRGVVGVFVLAFASHTVRLQPFPPGRCGIEVQVRDGPTRADAKATMAFTVASGLR